MRNIDSQYTTWFASSIDELNHKLSLADEFYALADIKIKKDKYKLLTNISKPPKEVTLTVSHHDIRIAVSPTNKAERILGVMINANNRHSATVKKIRQTIYSFTITVRKKKATHDQIRYLINKIIIPRIEYLTQFTVLSQPLADSLMRPLKKLFKHSLNLSLSTPDSIIYNSFFSDIPISFRTN